MADPKFIDAVLLQATAPPRTVVLSARVALLVPRMEALLRSFGTPADADDFGSVARRIAEFDRMRVALLAEIDAARGGRRMICATFPRSACAGPIRGRGRRALFHHREKGAVTAEGEVTMCEACQAAYERHSSEVDARAALCGGRCNKFGCDTPCDQLPNHEGLCSCRNRRARAVVDAGTCATCRAADGLIADATPACEHVANGTGVCRCVLVQAKGGG